MVRLPKCDELKAEANSSSWTDMLVLYCRKSASEDLKLGQQIYGICGKLLELVRERAALIDELESVGKNVPQKMAEFLRTVQAKDNEKMLELQIMGRKLELSARDKDLFIERLTSLFSL